MKMRLNKKSMQKETDVWIRLFTCRNNENADRPGLQVVTIQLNLKPAESMTWRITYKCNASRTHFSCGFQLSVSRQEAPGAFCSSPTDVLPWLAIHLLQALEGALLHCCDTQQALVTHSFPPHTHLHVHSHRSAAKACVWSHLLLWTWKVSSQILSRQA